MIDSELVSPEAAEFLTIMLEEIRLPHDWDVAEFWLSSAQHLAQFLADHRGKIALDDAAMLTGIGGMMVVMAKRELEASEAAKTFLRGNGGVA